MKKVIIYRKELLRYSETFIKSQALALSDWSYLLLGERLWDDKPLSLEGTNHKTLIQSKGNKLLTKLRQITGIVTPQIASTLKQESCNLFHTHFGHDALLSYPYARLLGVPMVVTFHGHDINTLPEKYYKGHEGKQKMLYPLAIRALARKRDVRFIAVSDALRKTAIELYNIPADKIRTVYTGIDTKGFSPGETKLSDRKNIILFVGRLVEMKGCEYLIDAFKAISATIKDAELHIIGDGPLREQLKLKAAGANITFHLNKPPSFVKEYLGKAKTLCLPSITCDSGNYESFGMVLLEAQASGVPVVTSANAAPECVIHQETGFIFKQKDTSEMTRGILELLSNNIACEKMGYRAASLAKEKFDIRKCAKTLEGYYDDILRKAA